MGFLGNLWRNDEYPTLRKPQRLWLETLPSVLFALVGCSVEQTEEGELPEVEVSAEGGNMPEYEVDTADVDVGTKEKTITVPDEDVDMPDDNTEQ